MMITVGINTRDILYIYLRANFSHWDIYLALHNQDVHEKSSYKGEISSSRDYQEAVEKRANKASQTFIGTYNKPCVSRMCTIA